MPHPLLPVRALAFVILFALPLSACGDAGEEDPLDVASDSQAELAPPQDAADVAAPDTAWEELPPDVPAAGWYRQRQDDYLAYACAKSLNPGSVSHLLAHLTCAARGLGPAVPADVVPAGAWDGAFDKHWRLKDTSDFGKLRHVILLHAFGGDPSVPAELWAALERSILDFKYWFTDPTPVRIVDGELVKDTMWYWSENHVLIFRASEYLAGQRFPDETFTVSGETGAWHRARARAEILTWLEERARWGFTEWHSNVYYQWDVNPLVTLIEWADDDEIVKRASMVLDLVLLDIALHLQRGCFGATHGRSYIKDKPAAELEDTFTLSKLLFDDTSLPYASADSTGAVLLAISERYALPWAVRQIARSDAPMVDRERMNLPIAEEAPEAWDDPVPPPPYGLSYTDEERLPLWWSMSGFIAWPLLPMTFDVATRYGLWEGQFEPFSVLSDVVDVTQPTEEIMKDVHPIYRVFWRVITSALLEEVHTYTWRSEHAMLSSAIDYRKGVLSNQIHAWQATISEHALVFTTQPGYLPVPEGEDPPDEWNWQKMDEPGPGYWTGSGSLPRVGQHENVAVILYAPQFTPKPLGIELFNYLDETHAYVPQAHMDEVVEEAGWLFAREGEGFVALWSQSPPAWRDNQPEVFRDQTEPFDWVAPGAQNAWVVELGDAERWREAPGDTVEAAFEAFRAAIGAAEIEATPLPDQEDDDFDDGFDVTYDSPSQGRVRFGWHGPLTVAGEEVPLRWEWRYDNPFVRTRFDDTRYEITINDARLLLDFEEGSRQATAGPDAL
jgi:hypothetical protein